MFDTLYSMNKKLVGAAALLMLAGAAAAADRPVIDFHSCAKPEYPKADVQAMHEGAVMLEFQIDAQGAITDSKIKTSSGFASLDEAARGALAKCRFIPAKGKTGARTWVPVRYVWTLK